MVFPRRLLPSTSRSFLMACWRWYWLMSITDLSSWGWVP